MGLKLKSINYYYSKTYFLKCVDLFFYNSFRNCFFTKIGQAVKKKVFNEAVHFYPHFGHFPKKMIFSYFVVFDAIYKYKVKYIFYKDDILLSDYSCNWKWLASGLR